MIADLGTESFDGVTSVAVKVNVAATLLTVTAPQATPAKSV